ncbi:MAG: zf-HC2 domain-containing protein [Armatimonadota bacterium]|nr:zf-HC2 domain-containing protein [Armatimonadota bacterium]
MKCETAQQVFSDYLEETIEKPLALTFEHHLEQCDECRRSYGEFHSAWRVLEAFPTVEPPSGFRESVLSRVKSQQETAAQKTTAWRFNLSSVLGARLPTHAFAWALTALIFAVLLVRVSPPVFQAALTGPFGGSWVVSESPGMEVGVRAFDAGTDADVYQVVFKPTLGAGQIDAKVFGLRDGNRPIKTTVYSGRETPIQVVVKQPQGVTEPFKITVRWSHGGRNFTKYIFLPRSRAVSELPYRRAWKGEIYDSLRVISEEYGVAVSADAGLKGSVSLSSKLESGKDALNEVAGQIGLQVPVRREGSRAYKLEPKE